MSPACYIRESVLAAPIAGKPAHFTSYELHAIDQYDLAVMGWARMLPGVHSQLCFADAAHL